MSIEQTGDIEIFGGILLQEAEFLGTSVGTPCSAKKSCPTAKASCCGATCCPQGTTCGVKNTCKTIPATRLRNPIAASKPAAPLQGVVKPTGPPKRWYPKDCKCPEPSPCVAAECPKPRCACELLMHDNINNVLFNGDGKGLKDLEPEKDGDENQQDFDKQKHDDDVEKDLNERPKPEEVETVEKDKEKDEKAEREIEKDLNTNMEQKRENMGPGDSPEGQATTVDSTEGEIKPGSPDLPGGVGSGESSSDDASDTLDIANDDPSSDDTSEQSDSESSGEKKPQSLDLPGGTSTQPTKVGAEAELNGGSSGESSSSEEYIPGDDDDKVDEGVDGKQVPKSDVANAEGDQHQTVTVNVHLVGKDWKKNIRQAQERNGNAAPAIAKKGSDDPDDREAQLDKDAEKEEEEKAHDTVRQNRMESIKKLYCVGRSRKDLARTVVMISKNNVDCNFVLESTKNVFEPYLQFWALSASEEGTQPYCVRSNDKLWRTEIVSKAATCSKNGWNEEFVFHAFDSEKAALSKNITDTLPFCIRNSINRDYARRAWIENSDHCNSKYWEQQDVFYAFRSGPPAPAAPAASSNSTQVSFREILPVPVHASLQGASEQSTSSSSDQNDQKSSSDDSANYDDVVDDPTLKDESFPKEKADAQSSSRMQSVDEDKDPYADNTVEASDRKAESQFEQAQGGSAKESRFRRVSAGSGAQGTLSPLLSKRARAARDAMAYRKEVQMIEGVDAPRPNFLVA